MAAERVLAEIDSGIGLITFDDQAHNNALSPAMWEALGDILDRFAADDSVRVVVLTGAGPRAFVADPRSVREPDQVARAALERLERLACPVIARIRGACIGDGLALALQADLRIAAEDSEYGLPTAGWGPSDSTGVVSRLVRLVGPGHASMLLFTGARIDAAEASRIGLVNRVVPDADLSDTVVDLARMIADNTPQFIRAAKRAVAGSDAPAAEGADR